MRIPNNNVKESADEEFSTQDRTKEHWNSFISEDTFANHGQITAALCLLASMLWARMLVQHFIPGLQSFQVSSFCLAVNFYSEVASKTRRNGLVRNMPAQAGDAREGV